MKNKLKGLTLLETVIYLGLFSMIMFIIINFMFSTQEATLRTQRKSLLHETSQFITQHLSYTFEEVSSIDAGNSEFLDNQGRIELVINGENKAYEIHNTGIYYDAIPLTPSNIIVNSFYIEPIYEDLDIIAVRISFILISDKDPNISETTNLLFTIR